MSHESVLALLRDGPLMYVDCGARAGSAPSWLRPAKTTNYIGIEADVAECARLNGRAKPHHRYIPAVLAASAGHRELYVTRDPACSSLLRPNHDVLAPFEDLRDSFLVERTEAVTTTTLETCLATNDVRTVDFVEVDTQGAELEVLAGADSLLHRTVVGVQVEVEFVEMYERQPLFGDVDAFLRERGFMLFDLARYHVRRGSLAVTTPTRGQLLWGQAFYLRKPARCESPAMQRRLIVIAALAGIADVALEVLAALRASAPAPEADDLRRAERALTRTGSLRVWRD